MNNKRIGTEFEIRVCKTLNSDGWWVHFITPDRRGAQPFDIIACKDARCIGIDCKTSKSNIFRMDRLEWNQILAFDKWIECGNKEPLLFVEFNGKIIVVPYLYLKFNNKIHLEKCTEYSNEFLQRWCE